MRVDLLSLFPEYFESPVKSSILGRAVRAGIVDIQAHQLRDYSLDRHRRVDDRSFGGGPGMVLMPQPLDAAIKSLKREGSHVVYLSPAGKVFNRQKAYELASYSHLIFICGHYEGIDQRIIERHVDEEISIGDFVLTNGCLAALVVLDATARFLPGVLGDEASREQDSFERPCLDYPHYTLPREYEGDSVPEVLTSGNHQRIEKWRTQAAELATWQKRPDLVEQWHQEVSPMLTKYDHNVGCTLSTEHLAFYRKCLGKDLGLPWIDKSATMGALLLTRGEILFWERADACTTEQAIAQVVAYPRISCNKTWRQIAKRWVGRVENIQIAIGENWLSIQDPIGWRLVLKPQEDKEL